MLKTNATLDIPAANQPISKDQVQAAMHEIEARMEGLPEFPWRVQGIIIKGHDNVPVMEAIGANVAQRQKIATFMLDLPDTLAFMVRAVKYWQDESHTERRKLRTARKIPKTEKVQAADFKPAKVAEVSDFMPKGPPTSRGRG
jgi:hypothetical protein